MDLFVDYTNVRMMKAIKLLDKVIDLQPNHYGAHDLKFSFQLRLGLFDDAISTLKAMEQLKPNDPDIKTMLGAFYEHHENAIIKAKIKYEEADSLFISILETTKLDSQEYESIIMGYTINLKLLGRDSLMYSVLYNYYGEEVNDWFINQYSRDEFLVKKYFTYEWL